MGILDQTTGIGGAIPHNAAAPRVVRKVIDLDAISAANADVVQAIPVKAGTFVLAVLLRIVRAAAGTTATADIGDGDNADGYDAAVNLKAAANTVTQMGLALTEGTPNTLTDAYAGGRYYAAADTIDLTLAQTSVTDAGKVELIAIMIEAVNAEDLAS